VEDPAGMRRPERGAPSSSPDRGWSGAALKALAVIVLCWVGFLFVPDRLLVYLTTRVSPHTRDALVSLWVVAFFVALSWAFVALQSRRSR
jgi:hypothetical protein